MEYTKISDVKKLRDAANIDQIQFGKIFGYKRQQVSIWENNPAKLPFLVNKLSHLLFWKELETPREEIIKELRLNENLPAAHEPEASYTPQTEAERYYFEKWQEVEKRAQIYSDTIELLREKVQQLKSK